MFRGLKFDDCVLAGFGKGKQDIDQWQLDLPMEVRSQVVAILEAPDWDELPQDTTAKIPSRPTSEEILAAPSVFLGIVTVAAILCGILFGFIFQSAAIVFLCLAAAAFSLAATIFLQSRAKGYAAAFGVAPSTEGTWTCADFVRFQMGLANTLRIMGLVLSITLAILMFRILYAIDYRFFGGVDSVFAASIRAGTIFIFPITIWIAWNSCWQKRGVLFKLARCSRGFLAGNLSPLWVSWLYEAKRKPAKVSPVEQTERTIKQFATENWLLLALFLICFLFFANTQWMDGRFRVETVPGHPRGKVSWVNYLVQWMVQHPTSTLFIAGPLGSLSIAVFAYQFLKLVNPKFSGYIAIAIFFLSILLFAVRGAN